MPFEIYFFLKRDLVFFFVYFLQSYSKIIIGHPITHLVSKQCTIIIFNASQILKTGSYPKKDWMGMTLTKVSDRFQRDTIHLLNVGNLSKYEKKYTDSYCDFSRRAKEKKKKKCKRLSDIKTKSGLTVLPVFLGCTTCS